MSDTIKKVTDEELGSVAGGIGPLISEIHARFRKGERVRHKTEHWVGDIQDVFIHNFDQCVYYNVKLTMGASQNTKLCKEDDLSPC